jgi:wyosine [tRNA(Phe)-imidazoG37] synthetase (radical SAM superfamily)
MPSLPPTENPLFISHPRGFAANRYVYPVLSRRSGGISIGVNLSVDRVCNFDCVYCQVDRTISLLPPAGEGPGVRATDVDLKRLAEELDRMVEMVRSGRIFDGPPFRNVLAPLRRLNDIAFSGDGEPTASPHFAEAVEICAEIRRRHRLDDVKIVLITNATLLDRPEVRRALETLDAANGEIWAKLDAGTEAYYRTVNRSAVPWRKILDNLHLTAAVRPIVIQTLFMRMHNEPPPETELEAYCDRLCEISSAGGKIRLVQIHTIARPPAEPWAAALSNAEVDAIADRVRRRTGLPVAAFYGG